MRTLCNPFLPIIRADDAIIRADEPHAMRNEFGRENYENFTVKSTNT